MRPKPLVACCLVTLLLAGCGGGYDPQFKGDHGVAAYQADLVRCRKQASLKASRIANATPQSAIASVFASSEPERADVRTCLGAKGYVAP